MSKFQLNRSTGSEVMIPNVKKQTLILEFLRQCQKKLFEHFKGLIGNSPPSTPVQCWHTQYAYLHISSPNIDWWGKGRGYA